MLAAVHTSRASEQQVPVEFNLRYASVSRGRLLCFQEVAYVKLYIQDAFGRHVNNPALTKLPVSSLLNPSFFPVLCLDNSCFKPCDRFVCSKI